MSIAIPADSAKPERARTPTASSGGFLGDIGRRPATVQKKTNVLGPDYLYIRQQKQAARQKELERRQLQNPHLHPLVAVGVDEQPLPVSNGSAKSLRWKDTVQKQHIAAIQMFTREPHEWDEQFTTFYELASAGTFADQRQVERMMERTKRQLAKIVNGGRHDEQDSSNEEPDEEMYELDEQTAANTAANVTLGNSRASASGILASSSTPATATSALSAATPAAQLWLDQKPLALAPLSLPSAEQQNKKREFGPMVFPPHKSPRTVAAAAPTANMGMMMFPTMPAMMGPPLQMPQTPVHFPTERLALPPAPPSSSTSSDLEICPF